MLLYLVYSANLKKLTGSFNYLIFIQPHINKNRNNIEKSNESGKPRCLNISGKNLVWQQFQDAFEWDQESISISRHEKLSRLHFELDPASKMRNCLAEDVLDEKMSFLMQVKCDFINR